MTNCKSQTIYTNSSFCSECLDGYYLRAQNPLFKNLFTECTKCDSINSLKQEKYCLECSQILDNCNQCNSTKNCHACNSSYYLRLREPNSFDFFCDPCKSGGRIEGNIYLMVFFFLNFITFFKAGRAWIVKLTIVKHVKLTQKNAQNVKTTIIFKLTFLRA